ncbi:MAG: class I SAM-dependent methyltransferase [Gammaproteobacteria bacterium]|nr:class I SAM-dependent methyltransferase [Gammaproteobacteria bacterium]MDH3388853.1 class I SAM-dependent methyltransferase [Gammaproteobacteria bacterium]
MNPVSNTAYYSCGVRMDDAKRDRSVCNDIYAHKFMDARGLEIYQPFRSETMPNLSNIARCRIIDERVSAELHKSPSTTVITIGAGFDTRPYRLRGCRWIELDEPQVIEYKQQRLSESECENPLTRIAIDLASEALLEKLSRVEPTSPVVIVIGGVFMNLDPAALAQTLQQVQRRFPRHALLCDLMTRRFFDKFAQSVHGKLVAAGGQFSDRPENPAEIFLQHNYRLTESVPMLRRANEPGLLWDELRVPSIIFSLVLNVFKRDLQGYAVHRFDFG